MYGKEDHLVPRPPDPLFSTSVLVPKLVSDHTQRPTYSAGRVKESLRTFTPPETTRYLV